MALGLPMITIQTLTLGSIAAIPSAIALIVYLMRRYRNI